MAAPVGQVDNVVGPDIHGMRLNDVARSPRAKKPAVTVEHQDRRVLLLLADVDSFLGVHHYTCHHAGAPPLRQRPP